MYIYIVLVKPTLCVLFRYVKFTYCAPQLSLQVAIFIDMGEQSRITSDKYFSDTVKQIV